MTDHSFRSELRKLVFYNIRNVYWCIFIFQMLALCKARVGFDSIVSSQNQYSATIAIITHYRLPLVPMDGHAISSAAATHSTDLRVYPKECDYYQKGDEAFV